MFEFDTCFERSAFVLRQVDDDVEVCGRTAGGFYGKMAVSFKQTAGGLCQSQI